MIRSMTGFGSASRELAAGTLTVELKSVNHRHLNTSFRLPAGAEAWEPALRARLGKRLRRGHITFHVSVEAAPGRDQDWEIDRSRVRATLDALRALGEEYDLPGEIDLRLVVAASGEVLRDERSDDLGWVGPEALEAVVDEAVDELLRMREVEGSRLEVDLRGGLAVIDEALGQIEELAPARLNRERDRLRRVVEELTDGVRLDDQRLEQEIALMADKGDITEELVRAKAHVEAFREFLEMDAAEPVGKRLSFLLQEMNREVNTVGSKANDTEISRHVVETKNALERLREQVENIE